MTIGERRIRGINSASQGGGRDYQAAKSQGYVASLLTDGTAQHLHAIRGQPSSPGKEMTWRSSIFTRLITQTAGNEFRFFPMVVGPRFNPPGMTNGIGAVARGAPANPVRKPKCNTSNGRTQRARHLIESGSGRGRGHRRPSNAARTPRRTKRRKRSAFSVAPSRMTIFRTATSFCVTAWPASGSSQPAHASR